MKSYFCFNRILAVVILVVALATIFFACGKDKDNKDNAPSNERDNKAIAAAGHEASASALYDDLFEVALQIGQSENVNNGRVSGEGVSYARLGNCFQPTISPAEPFKWPKTIVLDFKAGCADQGGRIRTGKVNIVLSDFFLKKGASATITLENYTVNGISIKGTKTITNQSEGNGLKYSTTVEGGIIKLDTVSLGYTAARTVTQTEGMNTPLDVLDDAYSITGTTTLKYPGGATVVTTTNAVIKRVDCAWPSKGIATIQFDAVQAKLDYGTGICDDLATITLDGKSKEVKLPR